MQQFHKFITWRLMCGSTCCGLLSAHYQERTTAIGASSFTWDHDQQRSNRHAPTVKLEAPSAVVRSWWWAERRPQHVEPHIKRQVINLWNCCILLVDLFESYDDARTCERQTDIYVEFVVFPLFNRFPDAHPIYGVPRKFEAKVLQFLSMFRFPFCSSLIEQNSLHSTPRSNSCRRFACQRRFGAEVTAWRLILGS
jgi:hypothetical protein